MAAGSLQSAWSKRMRPNGPKMEASVFYNAISEITYLHFYHILWATQTTPDAVGEGTT